MISANNIFVKYGDRILFDHISITIGTRDRAGLVGRNGAGKSTFLKIIAGQIRPTKAVWCAPPTARSASSIRK